MTLEFGPPIPHVPGKPCPFPDAIGLVKFANGDWQTGEPLELFCWRRCFDQPLGSPYSILAFRLPADHHAYGPRVSRFEREPDQVLNVPGAFDWSGDGPERTAPMRVRIFHKEVAHVAS